MAKHRRNAEETAPAPEGSAPAGMTEGEATTVVADNGGETGRTEEADVAPSRDDAPGDTASWHRWGKAGKVLVPAVVVTAAAVGTLVASQLGRTGAPAAKTPRVATWSSVLAAPGDTAPVAPGNLAPATPAPPPVIPPPKFPDLTDQIFRTVLNYSGVPTDDSRDEIALAHDLCNYLATATPPATWQDAINKIATSGRSWSARQIDVFVTAAIHNYCPKLPPVPVSTALLP